MERFVYWGVFAAFGAIVLAYMVWMLGVEWADVRRSGGAEAGVTEQVEQPAPDGPGEPSAEPGSREQPGDEPARDPDPSDEGPTRTFWGGR